MSEHDIDYDELIDGLRRGDEAAVQRFCDLYGNRVERLADRHISGGLQRRVGPEDVVQSVCRTFVRRAKEGEFELPDSGALWALLCAITLSKVRRQARFHLRQKRTMNREQHLDSIAAESSTGGMELKGTTPAPDDAVEFADQFEQIINDLNDEERQLVDLKLQQCENDEIAEQMGCSERTVRRLLNRVRTRLERELLDA